MRDLLYLPLNNQDTFVIATDCSGSVGQNPLDDVKVDYDLLSYYTARVVLMELLSVDAKILGYTLNNFTRKGWEALNEGIQQAFNEIGLKDIPYIGSSETNFVMQQSAMGITIIGKTKINQKIPSYNNYAVIGSPLVGPEVIEHKDKIIHLQDVKTLRKTKGIGEMIPVGSKGIKWEFEQNVDLKIKDCNLNVLKSSGPSTCLILNYKESMEYDLKLKFSNNFHPLKVGE